MIFAVYLLTKVITYQFSHAKLLAKDTLKTYLYKYFPFESSQYERLVLLNTPNNRQESI